MISPLSFTSQRMVLPNGVRVIVGSDHSAPVVGMTISYGAGVRAERPGEVGFAHLLEHVLFHQVPDATAGDHAQLIAQVGGISNAGTTLDFTNFYQCLPSASVDLALAITAGLLEAPRLTSALLKQQVEVIRQEVSSVTDVAYGGFPWLRLPSVLFGDFANCHDGFSDFTDLDGVTPDALEAFFHRCYGTTNTVISICGDFDPDQVMDAAGTYFGAIPARAALGLDTGPPLAGSREVSYVDPRAAVPAVCVSFPVPDPVREFSSYLPYVVLAEVLAGGPGSRATERLVRSTREALAVSAMVGLTGEPFEMLAPTALLIQAFLPTDGQPGRVIDAITAECTRLADAEPAAAEVEQAKERLLTRYFKETDTVLNRALVMSTYELQRGNPQFVNTIPLAIQEVTGGQVQAAASCLTPDRRATLTLTPGLKR